MNRLSFPLQQDLPPEVQTVLNEIRLVFGRVPKLFAVAAHYPPLLTTNWEKFKAVMLRGNLHHKAKEVLALLISKDNGCQYCVQAHTLALRSLGVSEVELNAILDEHLERAELSTKEILLITLARTANCAPRGISDTLFQRLREVEASEAEMVEALGVMELFVGFNKFLAALKIESES